MNMDERFELDPTSLVMLPSLPQEIELESQTYLNMILFYEQGIKGGITRAVCHYTEANNTYMYDYGLKKVHAF